MVSRLVAGSAPQFASLVKGRWPRRQARSEGLPRPEMPPPEAAATSPAFCRGGFHIRPRAFAPPQFSGLSPRFPLPCRAGVHARRTAAISKLERSRRRGVRDDLRPKSRALQPGWPPKRACGRSASIVPYRSLPCRRLAASRLAAGSAPQFASLVKGRWPRRQARSEGLPRPEMPPPEAAATRKVPPCAVFRERLPASKQSPSLRLSPQPAPFDKGAKPTRGRSRRRGARRDGASRPTVVLYVPRTPAKPLRAFRQRPAHPALFPPRPGRGNRYNRVKS